MKVLNGEGTGSVKKTAMDIVSGEVAKIISEAPESLDTLKEISDWIGGHENDASAMNSAIQTNRNDITNHTSNANIHVTSENKNLWNTVSNKVDKEIGKGLSTNDFTTADKKKLDSLATVATSGSYNDLSNKPTIPEKVDLSGYAPLASPALTGVPTAPTAAPGTNTTQVATTGFVQQEITDLKKSVSDGKTTVANAITAKGITTATDATFATMATNIGAIETGGGMSLNVFTQETEPETKDGIWVQTANPHQSVVVGRQVYTNTSEGEECWSDILTLPTMFHEPYNITVHDNKICSLISGKLYGYNGNSWETIITGITQDSYSVVVNFGVLISFDGNLHLLGGNTRQTRHITFNGYSCVTVSTLPYAFYNGGAVVYNNEIHILGGGSSSSYKCHYKFDGTKWTNDITLPYETYNNATVVYNNSIFVLGGGNGDSSSDIEKTRAKSYCYTHIKSLESATGKKISIYQNPSNTIGTYATNFISGAPITGENNKFPSGFDDVFYIDESENVEESPIYYGDGTKWIKFKN